MNGSGLRQSAPAATPMDLRDEAVGGRIHEVDPQVVARFKAAMAEKKKAEGGGQKTAVVANSSGRLPGGVGFNNRLPKREVAKEQDEMALQCKLSNEEIMAAHRRYVLENIAVGKLVADMPIEETPLMNQFKRRNLPVRGRNRRWATAADLRRICEVHKLEIRYIPVEAMPLVESAAEAKAMEKPETKPEIGAVAETAVSPVTGNVSSDLPAPSTNGTLELPAIHDQLAAVQQLMEMAQAQSVQVSGTILLNLVVEIQLQSGKEVPTPQESK